MLPLSEADRGSKGQALFMVKNDSPIKTIEDLVGKKIAVVTVGGACDLILNDVLHKKGLDYKSIGYTVMGVPDMAPTVLRGGVDAACIPEPLLSVVQAQGGLRSVFDLFSGEYDRFPLVGFPVTQKFAETNPNTVAALQRALAKGLSFRPQQSGQASGHLSNLHDPPARARRKIVLSYTPEKSDFTQLKKIGDLMDRLQMLPGKTQAAGRRDAAIMSASPSAADTRAGLGQSRLRPVRRLRIAAAAFRVAVGHFLLSDPGVRDEP